MRRIHFILLIIALGFAILPAEVFASPATTMTKAIAKFISKQAAEAGTEKLSKEVSTEVVERVSIRLISEGGEKALGEAAELASKHGPEIIRALDNAPGTTQVLKALDDLPPEEVSAAAARLASGSRGKELAKVTESFGADALRVELKHPGTGVEFLKAWGASGGTLCRNLSKENAIALGKHLDEIAELPVSRRTQLLEVIEANPRGFFAWLGRFVEANPGKTIGSATFLAVFLPNSERILGGDEIVYDAERNPIVVRKEGLVSGPLNTLTNPATGGISWMFRGLAVVLVAAAACYATIKLIRVWQSESTS